MFLFTTLTGFSTIDSTSHTDISATEIVQIEVEAFLNDGTSEFFYFTAEDDIRCELENICARVDVGMCTVCTEYSNGEYCCCTSSTSCDTASECHSTHCGGFEPTTGKN